MVPGRARDERKERQWRRWIGASPAAKLRAALIGEESTQEGLPAGNTSCDTATAARTGQSMPGD
jgi:hypothetical protein